MDDAELARAAQDRHAARERSEHLGRRVGELAARIADTEENVADVYEDAARLRPHAAERLRARAVEARDFADQERRAAAERVERTESAESGED
jgi:hypothetical protein